MKKVKYLLAAVLIASVLLSSVGCYMISGQKMDTVKGTYKLTEYTWIEKYERKEGYTPKTINYIEDEDYLYEDYLIITGSGKGYYVHKDAKTPAYVKEVTLAYQYSEEKTSSIEYVIFNDALSVNENSGVHKLGVNKKGLNYTKNAIDYTELISKKQMRSENITVRWEKVDKATDLTYVEEKLGSLKRYDYDSYGVRGIYELDAAIELETGNVVANEYQYFFYVIDTAENATTATAYYAMKESPTVQVSEKVTITHAAGDWSTLSLGGVSWQMSDIGTYYYRESDGLKYSISRVSNEISDEMLTSLVASRIPTEEN